MFAYSYIRFLNSLFATGIELSYFEKIMSKIKIEIVCTNIESVIAAEQGGADRVELCDNLVEGGTTPSYGMIEVARKKTSIGLFVMIRPRSGDFLYSEEEFEIMKLDIHVCKQLKADGVVFGLLDANGNVDVKRTKELVALAKPMLVTFHRAFDLAKDSLNALEDIINCGCNRILTSGQQPTAIQGEQLISQMIKKAGDRIIILPGGGIRPDNVVSLLDKTMATEIHSSAKNSRASKMKFKCDTVTTGNPSSDEYRVTIADIDTIRKLVKTVNDF